MKTIQFNLICISLLTTDTVTKQIYSKLYILDKIIKFKNVSLMYKVTVAKKNRSTSEIEDKKKQIGGQTETRCMLFIHKVNFVCQQKNGIAANIPEFVSRQRKE